MGFQKGNKVGKQFTKENQPENNGRKPKIPALDILLAEVVGEEGMKSILTALKKEADKGNVQAANSILDRQFGKATQNVDMRTTNDHVVTFERKVVSTPTKPDELQDNS